MRLSVIRDASLRPVMAWFGQSLRGYAAGVRDLSRLCCLAWRAAPGVVAVLTLVHLSLAVVPVAQVWLYKLLVDSVAHAAAPSFDPRDVWLAGAFYVLTLLFAQAAGALLGPLDDQLNERLQGLMRGKLLEVGERQVGLAFYDDEVVQNELETARRGLNYVLLEAMSLLPATIQKLAIVVTLSAVLARLHPLLPLLLIASAVPRFRFEANLRHYVWTGLTGRSPQWRWLNYLVRILISAEFAKEVRLFGLGGFFLERYRSTFESAHQEVVRIRRHEQRGTTLSALANALVTGAAYAVIVGAAAGGRLTLGDVALYTGATFQLSGALGLLIQFHGALVRHRLTLKSFNGLLERPPALAPMAESEPDERDGHDCTAGPSGGARRTDAGSRAPVLEFHDVWFSYAGRAAPALRGLELHIAPGEKIALVGENGAGKTTLLNLIARLYDPTAGEILADGVSLRALDVREWRRRLSNVSQEFLRLEASLRTNLAIGNLEAATEDGLLWAACDQAGLREAAQILPRKLDQLLGRRFAGGVELSGGEWQKVAIARALLRREAGIIILDEPTAALDAPTEHAIFHQFVQLAEHRTTVLVSHRFSTVHMAERIIVLESGAILEEGTHADLVARGGRYAELFELQAARYR